MRSKEINREIKLTPKDRDELIKELIGAGIDRKVVGSIFGDGSASCDGNSYCGHGDCVPFGKCDSYFRVNPDSLGKLKEAIQKKKIDPKALGSVSAKFLK